MRVTKLSVLKIGLIICPFFIIGAKFPAFQGFINDFSNTLPATNIQELESISSQIEQKTSIELVTLVVNNLGGMTIEEYSTQIFKQWGIGKKNKDNGVLLLVALNDKKVRIEVGYGLESILPDGLTGSILDRYVIPNFKKQDFVSGISYGHLAIAAVIAKEYKISLTGQQLPSGTTKSNTADIDSLIKMILFVLFIFIFLGRGKGLWLLFLLLGINSRGGPGNRFGGFGGSGFGGFGGGLSGGGGSSRGW